MSIAPRSTTPEKQSGSGRPVEADAGFARPRDLEEHAAELVVDLLVVLYSDSPPRPWSTGPTPTRSSRSGLPNARLSGIDELDLVAVVLDLDALASNASSCAAGVVAGRADRLDLAVDHAVRAVADDRELVRRAPGSTSSS